MHRPAAALLIGGPNVVPIHVPFSRISELEMSRGKSRSDGAIAGIKWGAPIMALAGLSIGVAAASTHCDGCRTTTDDVVSVTAVFAMAGAFYGAGIGPHTSF